MTEKVEFTKAIHCQKEVDGDFTVRRKNETILIEHLEENEASEIVRRWNDFNLKELLEKILSKFEGDIRCVLSTEKQDSDYLVKTSWTDIAKWTEKVEGLQAIIAERAETHKKLTRIINGQEKI